MQAWYRKVVQECIGISPDSYRMELAQVQKQRHDAVKMQLLAELSRKTINISDEVCKEALDKLKQLAIGHESTFFLYQCAVIHCIRALYHFDPVSAYRHFRESAEYLHNNILSPEIIEEHKALFDLFDELMDRRMPVVVYPGNRYFALHQVYRIISDNNSLLNERLAEELDIQVSNMIARNKTGQYEIWEAYWLIHFASHYHQWQWGRMASQLISQLKPVENEVFSGDVQQWWISFFSFRKAEWWPSDPEASSGLQRWLYVESILQPRGGGAQKLLSPKNIPKKEIPSPDERGLTNSLLRSEGMNLMFHAGFASRFTEALHHNMLGTGRHLISWAEQWPVVFRQKLLCDLLIHAAGTASARKNWKSSWKHYQAATQILLLIQEGDRTGLVEKIGDLSSGFPPHAEVLFEHLQGRSHTHFLFNCLNSMHLALYELPAGKIGKYLSQIRGILSYRFSSVYTSSVSLDEEMQFLYDYLCMEQFRFKERLTFSISADLDHDLRSIRIAPMIVQPILENAIKHGIRSLDTGKIEISVSHRDEGYLVFQVYDNGVGMKKDTDAGDTGPEEPESGQGQRLLEYGFRMIKMFWGKNPSIRYISGDSLPEKRGTLVEVTLPYTMHYGNG